MRRILKIVVILLPCTVKIMRAKIAHKIYPIQFPSENPKLNKLHQKTYKIVNKLHKQSFQTVLESIKSTFHKFFNQLNKRNRNINHYQNHHKKTNKKNLSQKMTTKFSRQNRNSKQNIASRDSTCNKTLHYQKNQNLANLPLPQK